MTLSTHTSESAVSGAAKSDSVELRKDTICANSNFLAARELQSRGHQHIQECELPFQFRYSAVVHSRLSKIGDNRAV